MTEAELELQLLDGCLAGHRQSQQQLYSKYHRKFLALCLRYAESRETAEDILQDAFVRIFTKLDTFRRDGSLEGWMRRIVVNTAIGYYRKQLRSALTVQLEHTAPITTNEPSPLQKLQAQDLLAAVQQLPIGCRVVFNLYAIEGYAHQEIADQLGISIGTTKSQLHRARHLLQARLTQTQTHFEQTQTPQSHVG
jgi:RNA polymerase sigma-70 factor (ECF subfamily)